MFTLHGHISCWSLVASWTYLCKAKCEAEDACPVLGKKAYSQLSVLSALLLCQLVRGVWQCPPFRHLSVYWYGHNRHFCNVLSCLVLSSRLHTSFTCMVPTTFVIWLNLCNTRLSPKRYWQGLRSQEEGEEGGFAWCYTATIRMTPVLRWATMRSKLMFINGVGWGCVC